MRVDTLFSMRGLLGGLLLAACESGPSTEHAVPVVPEQAPAKAAPAAKKVEAVAQVREDVPLALPRLLGRTQAELEAQFGAPKGKGMDRPSCVRFVPGRVFFACKYALRAYADPTGTFEEVQVAYEEGVVTELSFDGLKAGSGPFDPQALLGAIGLTLPEPGKQSKPTGEVRLWSWFNSLARLRIAGKEYRVEVSVVAEDWSRARVTIYENNRLTPEQTAKVVPPAGGPAISETPAN